MVSDTRNTVGGMTTAPTSTLHSGPSHRLPSAKATIQMLRRGPWSQPDHGKRSDIELVPRGLSGVIGKDDRQLVFLTRMPLVTILLDTLTCSRAKP